MPMSPRLLRPRQAGGFDPRTLGTLLAWYDFSDSSTLTLVSDFVSEIRNKSGTAPTLSQGIEANRPSLSTIGGRQAASFDGSNDHLFSNTAVQGWGTLFVAHGGSFAASRAAASFCTSASGSAAFRSFAVGSISGGVTAWGRQGTSGGGTSLGVGRILSAGSYVVSATFDQTPPPVLRANGVVGSGAGANLIGNADQASIGARNQNGYGAFWNSTIGEVLYYPVVLTASQITAVENYLRAKWSVTF